MEWVQTITIVSSLGAFTFWLFKKRDNDLKILHSRQIAQSQRIDHLYQIFIELLKEWK